MYMVDDGQDGVLRVGYARYESLCAAGIPERRALLARWREERSGCEREC